MIIPSLQRAERCKVCKNITFQNRCAKCLRQASVSKDLVPEQQDGVLEIPRGIHVGPFETRFDALLFARRDAERDRPKRIVQDVNRQVFLLKL